MSGISHREKENLKTMGGAVMGIFLFSTGYLSKKMPGIVDWFPN